MCFCPRVCRVFVHFYSVGLVIFVALGSFHMQSMYENVQFLELDMAW